MNFVLLLEVLKFHNVPTQGIKQQLIFPASAMLVNWSLTWSVQVAMVTVPAWPPHRCLQLYFPVYL